MTPFRPLFRNPHAQTIAAHFWRRPGIERPSVRRMIVTEPRIQVLVESARPEGEAVGEIVMVHGLEGSGAAGYIQSLAAAGLDAGYAVHRFHMRTCGGTEQWADTLYHAGLTSDLAAVLRLMREEGRAPACLVGFSLGGNVVLKLAGELGDVGPGLVRTVCAVSTPLDLGASARKIGALRNRVYELRFVRRMKARLAATGRYSPEELADLDTLLELDNRITAPAFGFGDAANYYRTQSSLRYLSAIRVPVLLIQSRDDTFIPFEVFESSAVRDNPNIRLLATDHGGHLGFLARGPQRFWLDHTILEWLAGAGRDALTDAQRVR